MKAARACARVAAALIAGQEYAHVDAAIAVENAVPHAEQHPAPVGGIAVVICAVAVIAIFVLRARVRRRAGMALVLLIAPIALGLALDLGYAPAAFLMTVAIAASTAFATPVASPVNVLVLAPGAYGGTALLRAAASLPGVLPVVMPEARVAMIRGMSLYLPLRVSTLTTASKIETSVTRG